MLVVAARVRARATAGPGLLTEPPENIHPAELAVLWGSFRRASPLLAAAGFFDPRTQRALFQTELLHLAQEGVIELQAIGPVTEPEDLRISLKKQPGPIDAGFIQFLFTGNTASRTLKEIAAFADRQAFAAWAAGLRAKVMSEMVSTTMRGAGTPSTLSISGMLHWALSTWMPLSRQSRGWPGRLAGLVGFLGAMLVGVASFADQGGSGSWLLALVCVAAGIVAVRLMPYRVAPLFRERLGRWASFRRFLVSHADMDDAPAASVAIWEKYLVYASALQAAEEVREQVRQVLPMSQLMLPWLGAPGGLAAVAWVQSLGTFAPAGVRTQWSGVKLGA